MAKATKKRSTEKQSSQPAATKTRKAKARTTKTGTKRLTRTRFMGVTVPKTLTSALDGLVNSPRGREILASALVAAASAAAAALIKSSDSRQDAREAVADVGDQVATATKDLSEAAAGALAEIVTGAARSFLPASLTSTATKGRRGNKK